MPRGQYDRSKMKKAPKTDAISAAPVKRGRKAKMALVGEMGPQSVPAIKEQGTLVGGIAQDGIDYSRFHNFGSALNTLTGLRAAIGTTNTTLQGKVDDQIAKVVAEYVECLFPVIAKPIEKEEIPAAKPSAPKANGTVAAAAPVAQAPVAFNPPAFTQPQS